MKKLWHRIRRFFHRWVERFRLWLGGNPYSALHFYFLLHEECCGKAALDVVKKLDPTSAAFNRGLANAYASSEVYGCPASGFMRRTMIHLHALQNLRWRLRERKPRK